MVFARRSDAFQALKRYNNVQLDGKPMKIEIVGANAEVPLSARVNVVGGPNGKKRTVVMAYVIKILSKNFHFSILFLCSFVFPTTTEMTKCLSFCLAFLLPITNFC